MFVRHPLQAIDDILEAIAIAQKLVARHTMASLGKDRVGRLALERSLEIISEASRHLPDALTDSRPDIPWADIRDIGNHIRHEYTDVALPIIWHVVADNLKPLKKACEALRRQATPDATSATPRGRPRGTRRRK